MFDQTPRKYKECSPEDSINRMSIIMQDLGLVPREVITCDIYPEIYSMRIVLPEEHGKFGANGKGRTREYCTASAYAELLERLQNGVYVKYSRVMADKLKKRYGFYYDPDEDYVSEQDFYELPTPIIEDIIRFAGEGKSNFITSYYERLKEHNVPGIVSIPFYDTLEESARYLPVNLLYLTLGSNGMAAGNSSAESIFQALCEIMERWSASEIYYKRLTPPTVPDEYLKRYEKEYQVIETIEKSGKYIITVKDFSANSRIPALGLIVTNRETNSYRLNVASETSFQIALSRCLTEVYQGVADEESLDALMLKIPESEIECFLKDDEQSTNRRYRSFLDYTRNNSGPFPISLFGAEADYEFDPTVFSPHESFEEEVNALIKFIHNLGHNVYIRDVGYLGFPSVYVYVPVLSAMGRKNAPIISQTDYFDIIELDKIEPLFFDFENQPDDVLRCIAETLDKIPGNHCLYEVFKILLAPESQLNKLTVSFFLSMAWYKLGEIERAKLAFDQFLKGEEDHHPYYVAVGKYLSYKASGADDKNIMAKLLTEVEEDHKRLTQEAVDDLSDPSRVFQFMKFPNCPNCDDCSLSQECYTVRRMEISHKLYPLKKRNQMDQSLLSWVVGKPKDTA